MTAKGQPNFYRQPRLGKTHTHRTTYGHAQQKGLQESMRPLTPVKENVGLVHPNVGELRFFFPSLERLPRAQWVCLPNLLTLKVV